MTDAEGRTFLCPAGSREPLRDSRATRTLQAVTGSRFDRGEVENPLRVRLRPDPAQLRLVQPEQLAQEFGGSVLYLRPDEVSWLSGAQR